MRQHAIATDRAAIYLLKAPAQFNVQINRELVVIFAAPQLRVAGVAVFPPDCIRKDAIPLLDAMLQKLRSDFSAGVSQIRLKIFGMSDIQRGLIAAVQKWVHEKHLRIAINETGGSVARRLIVECETGLVGVSYAEGIVQPIPEWLSKGSSSGRGSGPLHVNQKILILSSSPVSRQLCKQAIEAHDGWEAVAPDRPYDLVVSDEKKDLGYRGLIVFDDLGRGKPIEQFIKTLVRSSANTTLFWAGGVKPRFARTIGHLDALKPQSPKKFKAQLAKQIKMMTPDETKASVIQFPSKKKKK